MLEIDVNQNVAWVQMGHGKVNALDVEFCQRLQDEFSRLQQDTEVRGVVLSGNGRVFSAGVDLKRLVEEDVSYLDPFLDALEGLFICLFDFAKPLVACVNGHAVAGGCVMASAADGRVILPQARIGVPELRVGVPFPTSGMEIMRNAASPKCFRSMINAGATFQGIEAVDAGLADECAEPADADARCLQRLGEMVRVPAEVFELTKQQLRWPVKQRIAAGETQFRQRIHDLWRSERVRAAVKEYVRSELSG